MKTLQGLCQTRLQERADAQAALESKAEAMRVRLAQEAREVIRLVRRDVLKGTTLPDGATVGVSNSSIHGHQVAVRFPGHKAIQAQYPYKIMGDVLIVNKALAEQRWTGINFEINEQKHFDDFVDAAIWLLNIELNEEPPNICANVTEWPITALVGRIVKDVAHIGPMACIVTQDGLTLDIESDVNLDITVRCACGDPLGDGTDKGRPSLYCAVCGVGWNTIKEFLAWKRGEQLKQARVKPAISSLLLLIDKVCYDAHIDHVGLHVALDRFRCTCGEFPVEGPEHGFWCLRCCGHEWGDWEDFLEWREEQDA